MAEKKVHLTCGTRFYVEDAPDSSVYITVYEDEYDKAAALAEQVKGKLLCVQPTKENIVGITFTSSSTGHDSEPVKRYFVTLEFSIYERG